MLEKQDQATGRENTAKADRLYVAMELRRKKWKLGFSDGKVTRARVVSIDARNWEAFQGEIEKASQRFHLEGNVEVESCYEAGREGFWIHRALEQRGIRNLVVDAASIDIKRRKRAKTDRKDAEQLVRQLIRYCRGESDVWSVVRVPSEEAEDARQLHRDIEILKREQKQHRVRIQSLLFTQGIDVSITGKLIGQLDRLVNWGNQALGQALKERIRREYERLKSVGETLARLKQEQNKQLKQMKTPAMAKVQKLA